MFGIAILVAAVVGGVIFVALRQRSSPINRGIESFHREMDALAPRHPSAGLSGFGETSTPKSPDVKVSPKQSDDGQPADDQKPDTEA